LRSVHVEEFDQFGFAFTGSLHVPDCAFKFCVKAVQVFGGGYVGLALLHADFNSGFELLMERSHANRIVTQWNFGGQTAA
jgi:hypothetical protein